MRSVGYKTGAAGNHTPASGGAIITLILFGKKFSNFGPAAELFGGRVQDRD